MQSSAPSPGAIVQAQETLGTLRSLLSSQQAILEPAGVHTAIMALCDRLETLLTQRPMDSSVHSVASSNGDQALKEGQIQLLSKLLVGLPDQKMHLVPSPFMLNNIMGVESLFGNKFSGQRTTRFKKGSKSYEKKVEETKKQFSQLQKAVDHEGRLQTEVISLCKAVQSDTSIADIFFTECDGLKQLEALIFSLTIQNSAFTLLLSVFHLLSKLSPSFSSDSWFRGGLQSFCGRLLLAMASRGDIHVQRGCAFVLAEVAEITPTDPSLTLLLLVDRYVAAHSASLHPLAALVHSMVAHHDALLATFGMRVINAVIKQSQQSRPQLVATLEATFVQRTMEQFTACSSAQAIRDIADQLKRYQAWYLRNLELVVFKEEFDLANSTHRKLIQDIWSLRHPHQHCPISETSFGFSDNKDLWLDLGLHQDPATYFLTLRSLHDLHHFATTRTASWLGILDKLAQTRVLGEKAKGASLSKVDFDLAGVSVALTSKILAMMMAPTASVMPAQRLLWADNGPLALHVAALLIAISVFSQYKAFDRTKTSQIVDDVVANLTSAMKSVPPTPDFLYRLVTFLGARSTEADRQRTMRGLISSAGSSPTNDKTKKVLHPPTSAASAFIKQFPQLYKPTLDDLDLGPGGVPLLIISLTESILSMGGPSCVGLFRLQPDGTVLHNCEEELASGTSCRDVFRQLKHQDPNIPAIILKRILTALDPPLIEPYTAVVEAVRNDDYIQLMELLKKLDPINKATLNWLMNFFRYLSDPEVASVTKMDASNICMVFAPTLMRDAERLGAPSLGGSFLEKDLLLFLTQVADPIR